MPELKLTKLDTKQRKSVYIARANDPFDKMYNMILMEMLKYSRQSLV
jgi:hypothetical protein